jgi:CelD/BcsL family acetyltransferase involved in cellulose biosynthesis
MPRSGIALPPPVLFPVPMSVAPMTASPLRITLAPPPGIAALETRWRTLEAASDASFFQSWTWVGCLLERRFPRPVLLAAEQDGQTVALALLNRAGPAWEPERLFLGENGDPTLDAVYVEHNGPLLAHGRTDLLPACLNALLHRPIAPRRRRAGRRLTLSGVDAALLQAARAAGAVRLCRSSPAPFIDFAGLADGEPAFLASLSGNTRYQLRRSDRRYAAAGPIAVRRAASVEEALGFLDALAPLHQATWTARGRPGSFANADFVRFHRALIARGLPRGEVDLLRIAAGAQVIGYLYNFIFRGRVLSYQSGFDYAAADAHQKPGLTCHGAAIALYRAEGAASYDFLAGEDRYKTSLSNASAMLHWLEAAPRASLRGLAFAAQAQLRAAG